MYPEWAEIMISEQEYPYDKEDLENDSKLKEMFIRAHQEEYWQGDGLEF